MLFQFKYRTTRCSLRTAPPERRKEIILGFLSKLTEQSTKPTRDIWKFTVLPFFIAFITRHLAMLKPKKTADRIL